MAGNAGHIMNLANSVIGVGLLAMPFCFKQCGITLAILMLMLSSVISRIACHFLVRSSAMCRRRNFEFLAFYTFGPSGKLLVELGIIGFMMGTCVAFFVVMGDLGPAIISKILNINNDSTLRTSVLIGLGVLVILPLGLLRNIESLVAISTITIGFYFLFILKIFVESLQHLIAGDWWYHVNFWKPEGILQCIPIFAMSLSCQTQLFEIYESLPAPTVEKINSVVHSALNLCTAVYASVGFLGYVAYCKGSFTGNILLSFTPSFTTEMFKLGFVMSIAVSFPLVIFPCRASLYSLIFKRMPIHHEAAQTSSYIPDSRFKWLTIVIVAVSLVTGLLIPSIELVLGFVGSTIGIAICVIFPSLSFLNLNTRKTNDQMIAKLTVIIGVLIMIMGTFGNLFAAVENRSLPTSSGNLANRNTLTDFKFLPDKEVVVDSLRDDIGRGLVVNPILPGRKSIDAKAHEVIALGKMEENQRKEPPVPVAPPADSLGSRNIGLPQIHIKKMELGSPRKHIPMPDVKLNENINKDAIEKENREMLEQEKERRAEVDAKEKELLMILREHQDVQKKLLQEQKKILDEIKLQKKLKDDLMVDRGQNTSKAESSKGISSIKDVKSSGNKSAVAEFSGGSDKRKKTIEGKGKEGEKRGKERKVVDGVKSKIPLKGFKASEKRTKANVNETGHLPMAADVDSGLAKKSDVAKPSKGLKGSRPSRGREILNERNAEGGGIREKRDVNGSDLDKCTKTAGENVDGKGETAAPSDGALNKQVSQQPSLKVDLIKNVQHLSVAILNEKKSESPTGLDKSKMLDNGLDQSIINKKRDLKSIAALDN